jgi:hypothetical protein
MSNASDGWFDRFKNRVQLHNVKITGKEASANEDAVSKYPDVKKIIKDGGYTDQQIFKIMDADPNLDRSMQFAEMWIKHSASTIICMKI